MSDVRVLERVQRNCALGLRFIDTATGNTSVDGLQVEVYKASQPWRRVHALPNRNGVYVVQTAPGLRDFELADAGTDALWALPAQAMRVDVSDPQDRFLPLRFDALAPTRGLYAPLLAGLSPPQPGEVPLFSSPSRPLPDPLAVVRAQLRALGSAQPAAWALLGVAIGGVARGLGLADEQGRVAVIFPYPEPERRRRASPPEPRNDFSWSLELTAYAASGSLARAVGRSPDLGAVLSQLGAPHSVVLSLLSPPSSAPALRLDYRVPVTVRTAGAPAADASFLFFA